MSLPADTAVLMKQIVQVTGGMREGKIPSILTLTAMHGEAVVLYHALGEEECRMFSAKEKAYLTRKCSAARHHLKGRRELNLTTADAKEDAIDKTREEHEEQIDREREYEDHRILRQSLDRAIDFLSQTISTLKKMEARTATQDER